ncbi:hypothetical protein VTK56DRAFT_6389 [Thermocarpiscus australiensis]
MRVHRLPRLLLPSLSPLRHALSTAASARPVPDPGPVPEVQQSEQAPSRSDSALQSSTTHTDTPTPTPNPTLIYPPAPSPHHSDLPSFLAYAARTDLDRASTVYVGTHFEYTACRALARYGFSLRRVGGASDCGIDLLGTWSIIPPVPTPSVTDSRLPPPLRVLAQCKAVQRPSPHLIRELEGAFVGAPAGWRAARGVLGVLVTERAATRGIREALGRSRWPMGFVACSREGRVEQVLWNRRAEEEGLEGLGVATRYVDGGGGQAGKELVLTWRGVVLPIIREEESAG